MKLGRLSIDWANRASDKRAAAEQVAEAVLETREKEQKPLVTLMTMTGGGVRGLSLLELHTYIEEVTKMRMAELFTAMAGASTSAIVLHGESLKDPQNPAKPKYSATEIADFYDRELPLIFPAERYASRRTLRSTLRGSTYDPTPLENALNDFFGKAKVKDALTITMVPVHDIRRDRCVYVSSIDPDLRGELPVADFLRVATSALTFFPTKTLKVKNPENGNANYFRFTDGFNYTPNLPLHGHLTLRNLAPDYRILHVFAGTGTIRIKLTAEKFNALTPVGTVNGPDGNLLMHLLADPPVDAACDNMEKVAKLLGDQFERFNPVIDPKDPYKKDTPNYDLDDASAENRERLHRNGQMALRDNPRALKRVTTALKTNTPVNLMTEIMTKRATKPRPQPRRSSL